MENRPDFLFALMGLARLGATTSLINTNLVGRALVHAIGVCGAGRVLVGEERLDALEQVAGELTGVDLDKGLYVKRDEGTLDTGGRRVIDAELEAADGRAAPRDPEPRNDDVFCYIYTSGTTGLPKAAIIRNVRMILANLSFGHLMHRSGPGDVIYVTLPLYHSSAMFLGFGAALATGAGMALRRKFSASAFWEDVRRYDATSFIYIGELCRYLLNKPEQPGERDHRLRVGVGNGMRGDIWVPFQERFGVPLIREFYGATEGNAPLINLEGRPGMIGKLRSGQALIRCDATTGEPVRDAAGRCERISTGEIGLLVGRINRVTSFDGYVDESATEKKVLRDVFKPGDRWFDSGDLLHLHEGGWLSFADRAGDTFRWKGENVSTNEVADILDAVPGVVEANVYGVQIPGSDGRAGMAAIKTDASFDLSAFTKTVDGELASYQRPLFLRLLQGEMNITGTFKHQKFEYREQGWDLSRIDDPMYALIDGVYVPLDEALAERIARGEVIPG
jgi:acyl-CoA synthetase (AMP-forming)/AMP-acid ligase II